ncbi:hypothetical protein LOZ12_005609 [Ophidiomyces ophidiicola]|uniref:uncharacterized protein n=1 Tax=Ophidiomyces ophidiicola TaxID=1387563 RepID=UPI0020C1E0BC|nr:uncharacterized protein LOZ57_005041 [Ophidiomyces ophidiicola]KAI1932163.1 hypothetical protein LOZ62_006718 [Ophidiomyces ophidiicola]KAI1943331.1 hypothetical protein LOZ57_005041 [Ophidiomyces ophidiicola]KAI1962678.1 hypothetical protein LOZ59_002013 [Ophidiomyces ophidiicola]KAI1962721.1 hypothetical protein LOZ56_006562 [Ophidiomyces ophidiicola]KAI2022273.1 hypothetical protein LOZ45_004456 [Ophidiomyces ophidiicola]
MTSTAANVNAVAAALADSSPAAAAGSSSSASSSSAAAAIPPPAAAASYHRRALSSRKVGGLESTSVGSSSSAAAAFGAYLAHHQRKHSPGSAHSSNHSLHNNNNNNNSQSGEDTAALGRPVSTKHRSRRASEGSHLIKGDGGKRSLTELKCDRCGKGYKHSSCLTKHMWEHDPAWAYTSKLLISKHQQVQLLEAATVLVNMNQDPSDAVHSADSDRSSASPTASGISELRDELSSTETTPPPMGDDPPADRYPVSSAFSRSFHSVPSSSVAGSAPSYSPARSHFRHSSIDTRPSTADTTTGVLDDDEAGLAAAIELCNFGTPRSAAVAMPADVPPVPPLPARYLSLSMSSSSHATAGGRLKPGARSFDAQSGTASRDPSSSTPTLYNPFLRPLSYKVSDERDVKMRDVKTIHEEVDDDFHRDSAVPMDEDDDGVFGKMEE